MLLVLLIVAVLLHAAIQFKPYTFERLGLTYVRTNNLTGSIDHVVRDNWSFQAYRPEQEIVRAAWERHQDSIQTILRIEANNVRDSVPKSFRADSLPLWIKRYTVFEGDLRRLPPPPLWLRTAEPVDSVDLK